MQKNFEFSKGRKMKSETILKLKKVDKLMFTVNQADDPDDQLKIVIKFLNDFGMLSGDVSSAQVVEAYNQNVLTKIRQIIKNSKHFDPIPDFNQTTLMHFLKSSDDMEKELAKSCQRDFMEYAQIVLRFDDQLSTWKVEKSADDYRRAFADLDSKRTMIHNNCLHDIKILNRMAESAQPALTPFAVITPEMNRTNIGNGILKQYYKDLLINEKKVLG